MKIECQNKCVQDNALAYYPAALGAQAEDDVGHKALYYASPSNHDTTNLKGAR
jgi:hypothetical protein